MHRTSDPGDVDRLCGKPLRRSPFGAISTNAERFDSFIRNEESINM